MTVKEVIEELKTFSPDLVVRPNTGRLSPDYDIVAIYEEGGSKRLLMDLVAVYEYEEESP